MNAPLSYMEIFFWFIIKHNKLRDVVRGESFIENTGSMSKLIKDMALLFFSEGGTSHWSRQYSEMPLLSQDFSLSS